MCLPEGSRRGWKRRGWPSHLTLYLCNEQHSTPTTLRNRAPGHRAPNLMPLAASSSVWSPSPARQHAKDTGRATGRRPNTPHSTPFRAQLLESTLFTHWLYLLASHGFKGTPAPLPHRPYHSSCQGDWVSAGALVQQTTQASLVSTPCSGPLPSQGQLLLPGPPAPELWVGPLTAHLTSRFHWESHSSPHSLCPKIHQDLQARIWS